MRDETDAIVPPPDESAAGQKSDFPYSERVCGIMPYFWNLS